MYDKGYYHSLKKHPRDPHAHRRSTARSKISSRAGTGRSSASTNRSTRLWLRGNLWRTLCACFADSIGGGSGGRGALRRSPAGDILQDAAFRVDLGETVRAARVVALEPTDRSYLLSARHHRRVGTRDAQDGGADDLCRFATPRDRGCRGLRDGTLPTRPICTFPTRRE